MPVSTDQELQAGILKESHELSARKRKLEDDIRHVDAVNKSIQEAAAVRDIEAYKSQRPLPAKLSSR
jgi:hypothetical protein